MSRSHFENSLSRYNKIPEKLKEVGENVLGLEIPEQTVGSWRSIMAPVKIIDEALDSLEEPRERKELATNILLSLKGENTAMLKAPEVNEAIEQVKNLIGLLSEEKKLAFLKSLKTVLDLTQDIKIEQDPHKLVNLTRLEGQVFARILIAFLPGSYAKSLKYPKFTRAITRLGRAANSFDTFVDLKTDFDAGQSKVKPSFSNRLLFLAAAISDGKLFTKEININPKIVKLIAESLKNVVADNF